QPAHYFTLIPHGHISQEFSEVLVIQLTVTAIFNQLGHLFEPSGLIHLVQIRQFPIGLCPATVFSARYTSWHNSPANRYRIQDTGAIRVNRLFVGMKRGRGLSAFGETYPAAGAGRQAIEDDQVIDVRLLVAAQLL